jgi:hypothetical protein
MSQLGPPKTQRFINNWRAMTPEQRASAHDERVRAAHEAGGGCHGGGLPGRWDDLEEQTKKPDRSHTTG